MTSGIIKMPGKYYRYAQRGKKYFTRGKTSGFVTRISRGQKQVAAALRIAASNVGKRFRPSSVAKSGTRPFNKAGLKFISRMRSSIGNRQYMKAMNR